MKRGSRRMLAVVLAGLLLGPAGPTRAQDDFSFDIVEDQVADTDRQRLDGARDMVTQERFSEALAEFDAILADAKLKKHHAVAQYDLCKALYKMDAYHSALTCFQRILRAGPKHAHFGQSREWLFFIARKTKDELAPLELVARYAKGTDIPEEYQSELGYALGRYYFLRALDIGIDVVPLPPKPEPQGDAGTGNGADGSIDGGPDSSADNNPPDIGGMEEQAPDKSGSPPSDDGAGGFDFSSEDLGGGDGDWLPRASQARDRVLLAQDDVSFDFGEPKSDDASAQGNAAAGSKKGSKKGDKGAKKGKKGTKTQGPDKAADSAAQNRSGASANPSPSSASAPSSGRPRAATDAPKTAADALKLSLENLERVKADSPVYAQAMYVKGLVHLAKEQFDPAVKAFRDVVRLTNPRGGSVQNAKLREMAFFSLARIHYEFEQFRYAIFYYNRISRDSEQWLDAVFESSWAHFRLTEYEKALGNLVTLQSPFFQDEYYPEAAILKAVTFYENCRYPEARAFVGEFEQNYGVVISELDRLIGGSDGDSAATRRGGKAAARTATQLFDELTELERKVAEGKDDTSRSFAMTARLLRLALSDKRVRGFREAIDELDRESAKLQSLEGVFPQSPAHAELIKSIASRRDKLVALAGELLRGKLEAERKFLTDLRSKLVRIQFEITKGEKESLEAKISGQSQSVGTQDYRFITAVDDERLFWPFEGEYWRDELGTYQYTLTRGCRPPSAMTITGD